MNVLNKIKNTLFGPRFKPAAKNFISKDNLFSIILEESWEYTVDGNSHYFFSNDALKGGLDISMIWNRPASKELSSARAYANWLFNGELEDDEITEGYISGEDAIYTNYKVKESDLIFHSWFLSVNGLIIHLKFMIYEEEDQEIHDLWLERISTIMDNIVFNFDNFKTVKMK